MLTYLYENLLVTFANSSDPDWFVSMEANNKKLEYEIGVDIVCNISYPRALAENKSCAWQAKGWQMSRF